MATLRFQLSSVRPDLVQHLEKSIESVPHVQAVYVESDSPCVVVEHDGADSTEIIAAIHEEGFELQPKQKT